MTVHNDTTVTPKEKLQPTQTLEASIVASKLMEHQPEPAEGERTTVYLEFGAGLVFSINSDGAFSMHALKRSGRAAVELTPAETKALYHFWHAVCAPAIVDTLPAAFAMIKANRAKEETNGND
jgi:hypothetical protein